MNPTEATNELMPRTYDGIPTFATFGEHLNVDYDKSALSYVQDYADAEYKRGEKLAQDERITVAAKGQDIQVIFAAAEVEVQDRVKGQIETVERLIAEAVSKARRPLSPAPELAGSLDYVTRVLEAKRRAGLLDLPRELDMALRAQDKVTLSVLVDFGEAWHRQAQDKVTRTLPLDPALAKRLRAAEDALATPEARKARESIVRLEATRIRLVQAGGAAQRRFQGARIQGNALVDGGELAQREALRARL